MGSPRAAVACGHGVDDELDSFAHGEADLERSDRGGGDVIGSVISGRRQPGEHRDDDGDETSGEGAAT
jgi:hypothetical protein